MTSSFTHPTPVNVPTLGDRVTVLELQVAALTRLLAAIIQPDEPPALGVTVEENVVAADVFGRGG